MKKKTISAILTGVNIVLVIAIVILIVRISGRDPLGEEGASQNQQTMDEMTLDEELSQEIVETIEEDPTEQILVAVPQSTTSVNVRSGPGTDYDRIGSAYTDCEYEVIEVYSSGWTKLNYDGMEGYISSEFLSFKYKLISSDGSVSYSDVGPNELQLVDSPLFEQAVEENDIEDTTEVNAEE